MKYIEVTVKQTGQQALILEDEFNADIFSKKEEKQTPVTKENKAAPKRKTKAKIITSASLNESKG